MKRRKVLSVLVTMVFLLSALLPMAIPASAAATYSVISSNQVAAGDEQNIGTVKVEFEASAFQAGDFLIVSLPTDFEFAKNVNVTNGMYSLGVDATNKRIYVGSSSSDYKFALRFPSVSNAVYTSDMNSLKSNVNIYKLTANQIKIEFNNVIDQNSAEDTAYFYLELKNVYVDSGFSGDIKVKFEGKPNSVFSGTANVVVGSVGGGSVDVAFDDTTTVTSSGEKTIADLIIKEDRAGAFANGEYIKFKLPSGFKWSTSGYTYTKVWGDTNFALTLSASDDEGRTLRVTSNTNSNEATYIRISGLKVYIDDETVAKLGDINVAVSGNAGINQSTLLLGTYGEYGTKVYAVGEPLVVQAGRDDEEIGKFAIEELVRGSLVQGRSITMTLTGGAQWDLDSNGYLKDITIDTANSKNYSGVNGQWQGMGATTVGTYKVGATTVKLTVSATSDDKMKAVFEKAKIIVPPNASGDIKIVFGGTAGVTGEVTVAKVAAPATLSVEGSLPNVAVGMYGQPIADIIIKENKAEALKAEANKNEVRLEFFPGILPSLPSAIEVTEGDIVIDPSSVYRNATPDGRWYIAFKVKSTSTVPSTIKVKGIKVNTDRTVPEGPMTVALKGAGVISDKTSAAFPGLTSVAATAVANCITPAPGEQKTKVSFRIGDANYTVGGVSKAMDVAPYVNKDGRTFLPVRYVGEALGVASENIIWDQVTQTATFIKGDKVVQVKIGSNYLLINGVNVPMDTAAEIKDGRTMLPVRFVAQAFGAKVGYDDATQTVTLEL